MNTVSIPYLSGSGHATKLAAAIHKGAASVDGVQANLIAISGDDIAQGSYKNDGVLAQLDASDAIIFGSPTYMGGPAAQFKAFADATGERWFKTAWRDKLAAGLELDGAADRGVSEAMHLRDPDENGVEFYWDRPAEQWPRTVTGELVMFTHPLDLGLLLREAPSA